VEIPAVLGRVHRLGVGSHPHLTISGAMALLSRPYPLILRLGLIDRIPDQVYYLLLLMDYTGSGIVWP
jgi:hypothetical protein